MGKTQLDNLWALALASKCKALSSQNSFFLLLFIFLAWLAMAFFYWSHPGGPAWGRYWWFKRCGTGAYCNDHRLFINNPIPGPRGLPLLGSMNLMANLAHRKLAATAEWFQAKRLMAFSLGDTRAIITCNPDVAREILNSSVFADRPIKESAYSLMFNRAIGFAPYGVYWRTLRRIAATHMFSPKQIVALQGQRSRIACQMVSLVVRHSIAGDDLRVRNILKRASLHNMMSSVFGREYDLLGWSSNAETDELSRLVQEGYDLLGMLNWSDHLPCLASLDLQKIRYRCSQLVPKVNRFVGHIIQQHRDMIKSSGLIKNGDFVDVLLSLQGPDKLSDKDMVAVLWVSKQLAQALKWHMRILLCISILF